MFRCLESGQVWSLMACLAMLTTPVEAGEPYDMMKCMLEGRYCYDGDDEDIFDAILGIDPKKTCSCHDTPPPRNNVVSPFVGIRWHLVPGTFDLAVVSPTVFDEVRIKVPPGLVGGIGFPSPIGGWRAAECEEDRLVLEGPPSLYARWTFLVSEDLQPAPLEVDVRSSLGAQQVWLDPVEKPKTADVGVSEPPPSEAYPVALPEPDWDLGTLAGGRVYNTTVTAKNISCPGKHRFSIRVDGEGWLGISGPRELEKIKMGRSKTTEAVVDLRDRPPGEYRNRLLVDCLTCPPSCSQDLEIINVRVIVKP